MTTLFCAMKTKQLYIFIQAGGDREYNTRLFPNVGDFCRRDD